MILITKWFGSFLCEEENIVKKILFPKNAEEISKRLAQMQKGGVVDEEKQLAEGQEKLFVADRRQALLGKPAFFDSSFIRADMFGFDDALMHEAMVGLGKLRTSEPISRDKNVVQAIRHLDDLIETSNLLNERLHEWYGMHFPELSDYARDRRYAELVAKHGTRTGIIEELGLDIESIGSEFDEKDMKAVQDLASTLSKLYLDKERTESYISEIVDKSAPNLCKLLAGPLSARLISLAGGLERLATLPSSTIQLLGAEKAMFRHLKSGKLPPKHGVIYQYPEVHRALKWQRGAIARALACKISIAARIDAFGGEFRGEEILNEFMERVEEIKTKCKEAPKREFKKFDDRGRRDSGKRDGGFRRDDRGRGGRGDFKKRDGDRKNFKRDDGYKKRDGDFKRRDGDRKFSDKKSFGGKKDFKDKKKFNDRGRGDFKKREGSFDGEKKAPAEKKSAPKRSYGFSGSGHY